MKKQCLRRASAILPTTTAALLALLAATTITYAQTSTTWSGGGVDANWGTSANWNNGSPTTSGTWALTFNGSTRPTNTDNTGNGTTITLSSLTFSNTDTNVFTLNRAGNETLTLTDGATVSSASGGNSSVTDTINIPLVLSGNVTFNTAGHRIQVTASPSGSGTITKNGSSTLFFNSSASNNTVSNNIVGNAGIIYFNSGASSGAITLNGASFTGATGSYSSTFSLLQNAIIRSWGGATSTFTAPTFNTASAAGSNVTLTLGSATGTAPNEIQGTIQDNSGKTVALLFNGGSNSKWKLSGSNTFSGGTTIGANSTVLLGNATALGASTGAVTVQNTGALDLNGITITNTNSLSLNGTGYAGGGALINGNATAANYAGLLTLAGASSINATTGDILLSNTGTITGSGFGLTVDGAKNTTIAGIIGTGSGTLTKNGSGILTLSGNNTYSGATTVNAGILNFQTTGAKSASSTVTVAASATLGLGVGDASSFTSSNVDSLFAGNLPGVTMNATSGVAIDTTAGNFTYSTSQTNNRALTKIGANTLTLTGTNSYGATTISQGTLQIGSGGTAGTLGTGAVTNNGTLAFNRSDSYGGNVTNAISGTGAVTIAAGNLTLTGANTYSGGTQINGGTLKMGNATALGGNTASVSVASGATLDLNGQTLTTANTYALTLNGTGVSGGGALTNSGAAATYFGTVALAGDSTIQMGTNGINLGNATSANGITGSSNALTVGGGAGQLAVFGNIQTASVTMNATGTLRLESKNSFAGGLTIRNGVVVAVAADSLGGNGTGIVYLGDTSGSNTSTLSLRPSNSTIANDIIVQTGSSGTAKIDNFSNYSPTVTGNITLNKNLQLANTNPSGTQNLIISGTISGMGGLVINSSNSTGQVTLGGANTFNGSTTLTAGVLVLSNNLALQSSTLNTTGAGTITLASGVTTPTLGGLSGSKNLSSVITGNYSLITALTLNPGTGASNTYSGNITEGAVGMTLTKTGAGTQVLSGNNSYTGGTNINGGVLSLNNSGALGTTGTIGFGGGQLQYTANNNTDYSNRFSTAANQAYNIDTNSQTATLANALTSSGGSLSKAGSGTLILSANNTYSGATTISGGTLQLGSGSTSGSLATSSAITNNGTLAFNRSNAVTQGTDFASVISGAGNLTHSGTGNLTLNGNNTFSGGLTLQGTGAINLSHSNAAGSGTIFLKYASSSFVAKTLGISGGSTVANAIQIDSTTGREAIVSSGTGNNSLTGGITITGAGANSIFVANEQSSGNLTVSGGISGASYANQISLRGTQVGNVGFLNGAVTLASNASFDNNGATNWTLNTAGSSYSTFAVRNTGNMTLAVNDAIATGARVVFDIATSTGGVDLNGYNQTVAGIETTVTPTSGNGGRITNGGSSDSVLTLAGLSANRTFAGTITDGATNKTSLVMNSSGRTQTLNGANTFTGTTTINSGTLQAAATGALGGTTQISVNSGTLLVTASNALNDNAAVFLGGGTFALTGTLNESVGALTLSSNSVIDLAGFDGTLRFSSVGTWADNATLAIWNWNGINEYGTPVGNGQNNRHIVFTSNSGLDPYLSRISFYSDSGSSFVGNAFAKSFSGPGGGYEIIAVPEPSTCLYTAIFLAGYALHAIRQRRKKCEDATTSAVMG